MKDIWKTERKFWLEGYEAMQAFMDSHCILILPPPTLTLRGDAVQKVWAGLPVWDKVRYSDKNSFSRNNENYICLSYKVKANSEQHGNYLALCSSSYMRYENAYKLILHQQTPFF